MGKIILYGGTFDPVTSEHINVIKNLTLLNGVEKVVVIPNFQPPHKAQTTTSAFYRKEMLEISLKNISNVEISYFEISDKKAVYSYITVEHFKNLYPEKDLYFAMGTDMLECFSEWKNPEKILQNAGIILIERTNGGNTQNAIKNFEKTYGKKVLKISYKGKDVSSQEVRCRIYLNLDTQNLITEEVKEYIKNKNLYTPDRFYYYLSQILPEKRRWHTLGVILCGKKMAKKLKVDEKKVEIACLLHDNAKYLNYKDFNGFTLNNVPKQVVHQFLGAFIAENILAIKDEQIINAIKYHTTGKADMNLIEKIVFTADVIERGRDFDGVEKLRASVEKDFEKGFRDCICDLYFSLQQSGIYYLTEQAYLYYK